MRAARGGARRSAVAEAAGPQLASSTTGTGLAVNRQRETDATAGRPGEPDRPVGTAGVGVATVSGDIGLSTDPGRLVGRILSVVRAQGEVERKSTRQQQVRLGVHLLVLRAYRQPSRLPPGHLTSVDDRVNLDPAPTESVPALTALMVYAAPAYAEPVATWWTGKDPAPVGVHVRVFGNDTAEEGQCSYQAAKAQTEPVCRRQRSTGQSERRGQPGPVRPSAALRS